MGHSFMRNSNAVHRQSNQSVEWAIANSIINSVKTNYVKYVFSDRCGVEMNRRGHTPPRRMHCALRVCTTITHCSLGSLQNHLRCNSDLTDSSMEVSIGKLFHLGNEPPAVVILSLFEAYFAVCQKMVAWMYSIGKYVLGSWHPAVIEKVWAMMNKVTHPPKQFGALRTGIRYILE